jgi:hypothetical protein
MTRARDLVRNTLRFGAPSRQSVPPRRRARPAVEELEVRNLLSAVASVPMAHPNLLEAPVAAPLAGVPGAAPDRSHPDQTAAAAAPYTPAQVRAAYGFNFLSRTGAAQTIAIVDAYDDPNIAGDVQNFSATFGLPQFNTPGGPSFTKVSQSGAVITGSTNAPAGNVSWGIEESLDVEWAHAIAPQANIVLVEASSTYASDLMPAVSTAAGLAGVVSMSWGVNEFPGETGAAYDGVFAAHPGVTFIASSGDSGSLHGPEWPSVSPYVLGVGGTSLTADAAGNYLGESGWGNAYHGNYATGSYFYGGSGGGISQYESQPSYQKGAVSQSTTRRTSPDVAYDANPNTGVYVYDSYGTGGTHWGEVGGTSAGAPQWAGLTALVNQTLAGQGSGAIGQSATALIYNLAKQNPADFHDVTTGNNGYAAGKGYDLVTGVGSPVAATATGSGLVSGLAALSATAQAAAVKTTTTSQATVTTTATRQGATTTVHKQDVTNLGTTGTGSGTTAASSVTGGSALSFIAILSNGTTSLSLLPNSTTAFTAPAAAAPTPPAAVPASVTPVAVAIPLGVGGPVSASWVTGIAQSGGGGSNGTPLVEDNADTDDSSSDDAQARTTPALPPVTRRALAGRGEVAVPSVFTEAVRQLEGPSAVPTGADAFALPADDAAGTAVDGTPATDEVRPLESQALLVLFALGGAGLVRQERKGRRDGRLLP